jgi:hypothetical protein
VTTPKSKHRNLAHVNVTIDPWMDQWVRGMQKTTGLSYSRLMREIIAHAQRTGYTPGRVSLGDLRDETMRRARI